MGLLRKPVLRGGPEGPWRLPIVAIYSLNHSSIGRSTHAAGTAGAHIGYITRSSACLDVLAERMPSARAGERGGEARAWLDAQEAADRKNARVIDKVMLALPCELTAERQAALVRSFAESITEGRAPWLAAIHQDHPGNPHAHLVIRDKDPVTGKRVVGLSEKGSTDRLREAWERHANLALELAGRAERIDRRSLAAQGIDREAQVHVGPKASAIERQGKAVASQVRTTRRGREVRYPEIDRGRTRAQHNADIRRRALRTRQEPRQAPSLGVSPPRASQAPQRPPVGLPEAEVAPPLALTLTPLEEAVVKASPGLPRRVQPPILSPMGQRPALAALEALWERHYRPIFDLIRQGAGVLLEKLWGDQNALRVQEQEHRKAEPRLAKIRLFGGVERHRSEYARWAKAHEALEHQGFDFRRREEELKGFTHTSSLPQYPSDGEKLAAKIAAAAQPDLHQALTMARREAEKAKEAQRAREREQDRQRSKGRDRGGPER